MLALLLLCVIGAVHSCKYAGKTYRNGQEWKVNEKFVMKCTEEDEGSWKTEIVGCVLDDGTKIPLNKTKAVGADDWSCTANSNGMISLQQHLNANAKCGKHKVGSVWQEDKFEFECARGGQQKLRACFTDNDDRIPVNGQKEVSHYLLKCEQLKNGTVLLHGKQLAAHKPQVAIKCVDSAGARHNVGSFWLENERFNKTCTSSGRIEVKNCVTADRHRVPMNSEIVRNNMRYVCLKTDEGGVQFSAEAVNARL